MVTDTARGEAARVDAPATTRSAVGATGTDPRSTRRPLARFHRGSAVVLAVGLLVTFGLSIGAAVLNTHNEHRLLRQRAREVGLVATNATATASVPLSSASILEEATNGNTKAFQTLMKPLVGAKRAYSSASLWRIDSKPPRAIVHVGAPPALATQSSSAIEAFFANVNGKTATINDLLSATPRRLGTAIASPLPTPHYAVYTETQLPKNRKATIAKDSAFSDLGYALYLGKRAVDDQLLASSTGHGITGTTASATVPYGDGVILIVVKAGKQLGGTLLLRLPWLLAALGIALTAASTLLAERLIRRREAAEVLAAKLDAAATENERLYNEQRSVARTLQHTLLPSALPDVGLDLAARYVAGDTDVEIGGDWYDVIPLDDGAVVFVIGDVSGRGIPAATVMASLRYAVRAYALQGDAPDVIVAKLGRTLSIKQDGHFATVLCGKIDLATRRLEAANAGHLDALLITGQEATYLHTRAGVPIGAAVAPTYRLYTAELPRRGTLLLYTDGLIERRGESLDIGFTRLARAAEKDADAPVETLLAHVVSELIPGGASDDTALLALRWDL